MSQQWIQRILRRSKKHQVSKRARRNNKRRLLLESLHARSLLAADLGLELPMEPLMDSTPVMTQMQAEGEASGGQMSSTMGHAAAMALISADQATHTAVANGNWSDPATWENQALPTAGARILVPDGTTVTVDSVMATEFKTLGIHGTVNFATNVNTELRVDTIVSSATGRLEIGSAQNPIANDVTARIVFADDGAIDTNWDPQQLSRGAVLMGTTEIHGASTTHRTTLANFPAAGATSIQLTSVPENWAAGDQIVITGTQGSTSDEVRTIESIDGVNVNFSSPLELDHIPPKNDLNVYVANTSRNVQISSENPDVSRRGHIMVMHTLNANINNAELNDLGRTDKTRELDDLIFNFPEDAVGNFTSAPTVYTVTNGERTNVRGRYALHFHRGGVDPNSTPATVSGSVVNGSPGWGFVNHSANVNMINNVAYGVHGASFYTEVGDEIGSMVGNIAIRTVSPTFALGDEGAIDPDLRLERMDFGVDGDGYWLSGHMVSMQGNVSAGASGHGIIIWSDGIIEPDLARGRSSVLVSNVANGNLITGRETIPTWWAPLAEINNNESYGATIGFRSRYVHSQGYLGEIGSEFHTPPDQAYIDTLEPTIDGLTVWGSRDGMLLNYNERMSVKNTRLVGIGAPYVQNGGTADTGVGIDLYNEVTRGPGVIENVSIEGFNMGLLAPRQDDWRLTNIQLSNTTDMLITEMIEAPRTLDMSSVTFGSLAGTAVADQASSRQKIVMQAAFDANQLHPFSFMMSDRVTLDGQQLYFNQQAADFIPTAGEIAASPGQVPSSMIGLTNQQLVDRFGTSFGGAIIPSDATTAEFLTGGVVGSLAAPAATYPPIYHPAGESYGPNGLIIDPGTLTNFEGPAGGDGGNDDGGQPGDDDGAGDDDSDEDESDDDDGTGDDESDEDESDDDDGTGDDESDEDESDDDEGTGDDESDEDESDDDGGTGDDESDEDESDDDDGTGDDESDEDESDDDEGTGDDESDEDESDDDEGTGDDESDEDESDDDGNSDSSNFSVGGQTDVNNDGITSPMDVLLLINHLNNSESDLVRAVANTLQDYLDVSGDGLTSAMDVLLIINSLNQIDASGEGESDSASDSPSGLINDRVVADYDFESVPPVEDELLGELVQTQYARSLTK